jgi:hypothetical protein
MDCFALSNGELQRLRRFDLSFRDDCYVPLGPEKLKDKVTPQFMAPARMARMASITVEVEKMVKVKRFLDYEGDER